MRHVVVDSKNIVRLPQILSGIYVRNGIPLPEVNEKVLCFSATDEFEPVVGQVVEVCADARTYDVQVLK